MNPSALIREEDSSKEQESPEHIADTIARQQYLEHPQTIRLLEHLTTYTATQLVQLSRQHTNLTEKETHAVIESIHTTNKIIAYVTRNTALY